MSRRTYRFGEYRVDPASRELRSGDRLIALPPHVFDCLTYLIEHHDRAVGRDELVAAVWGKTEITDTLLGQTILRLRRELGDDAKDPHTLRTIPRFGYRWVAQVDTLESSDEVRSPAQPVAATNVQIEEGGEVVAAPVAKPNRGRSFAVIGIGVLTIGMIVAVGVWTWRSRPVASTTNPSTVSAAVMPAAVAEGAEWAWMRLGVMDVVAGQLRTSGLPSVPSENVVALLNAPPGNRSGTVRDALGIRLLVTPHVQRLKDEWLVELDADDNDRQHFSVDSRAGDATVAARAAADKLLVALGSRPADESAESTPNAILIKRIDAAVLADDPDTARTLIAQASAEVRQSPELRLRLAKIDFRSGRLDAAHDRLVALLDEAPESTAPVLRASILNGLGAVAIRGDHPQQAEQSFGEAIRLLESHADPAQLGQAYLGRAGAAAEQRHFDAATADYARARIAMRQANDTLALIRVAANEGFLDFDLGRPAQALPQFITATEGFKQWGALNEAILTTIGQIGCYLALLDGQSAMQAADAAEMLAQRIDNPATLASLTLARSRALAAVGRLREARVLLDQLRSANSDPTTVAAAGAVLARLELDNNHVSAAGDMAERTVSVLDEPNYARLRADAWLTEIRAALRAPDKARASEIIAALNEWAEHTDEPRAKLAANLARAEFAVRFGDPAEWRGAFDAARSLAAKDAVPYEIAAVAMSFANALFIAGDVDGAGVEVGRVSRWAEQDFDCAVLEARLYAALGRDEARQTALARARALAGERQIPDSALTLPITTRSAAQ
jgi:DNA-binding winged helix-turn-helix (wHTH) protein